MKAVRIHSYGGPEVLVYEEVERPAPGPHQFLVRVAAASVNPVDVTIREGRFQTPRPLPKIIGSDGAGVVEEAGPEATGAAVGDEVFFTGLGVGLEGSYAEYAVIAETQAVAKPSAISAEQAAAMALVFSTAYYALVRKAGLREGETVLVQGAAGGVGSATVQLAKALGARVIAVVRGAADAAAVRELGADEVIEFSTSDVADEARRLTEGKGVDVVHELVISANLPTDIRALAKGGRIVCTGQGPDPDVSIPIGVAIGVDAALLFGSSGNAGRAAVAGMLAEVGRLVEQGRVRPVIGATFPLARAREAHEALAAHHVGKIVLVP